MTNKNPDEQLLTRRRIDPKDPRSPLEQALRIGIYDEWHAEAVYRAVIKQYGPVRPFSNIVESEVRHANAIAMLMRRYGFALPVNDWADKVVLPPTLKACCEEGVADEIDNVAMYDDFFSYNLPDDVVAVFQQLRHASSTRHLPAFQRCVAGIEMGPDEGCDAEGFGPGGGRGEGHGRGHGGGMGQRRGGGRGGNCGCGARGEGRAQAAAQERDMAMKAHQEARQKAGQGSGQGSGQASGKASGKALVALAVAGAAVLGLGALKHRVLRRQRSA